jgi:hypothetical protein
MNPEIPQWQANYRVFTESGYIEIPVTLQIIPSSEKN